MSKFHLILLTILGSHRLETWSAVAQLVKS